MAMAISGRAAALVFPSTAATTPLPSTVSVNQPRAARQRMKVATAPHASSGGAVLERPAFDQSQLDTLPVTQEGGDPGRLRGGRRSGSGDSYKVLLVDDVRHTEKHGKYHSLTPFLLLVLYITSPDIKFSKPCSLDSRLPSSSCRLQWRRPCRRWCPP